MKWLLTHRQYISGPYRLVPGISGWDVLHDENPGSPIVLHSGIVSLIQAKKLALEHSVRK